MRSALWSLMVVSSQLMGATIAVIDSGVDVEHGDLVNNIWINPNETADNGRDEDKNGYQDDVYGWNFAERNNLVIDRKYIGTFSSDPYMFFDIQAKMFLRVATQAEIEWLKEKTSDPNFIKEMQKFGNFVHGTHVAGITVDQNVTGKILSIKLIPTEISPIAKEMKQKAEALESEAKDDWRISILKKGLAKLAQQQMLLLEEIAAYIAQHGADVANGSFGTGYPQAKSMTSIFFKALMGRDPSEEEANDITIHFLEQLVKEGESMVASAPKTLFVFASGNDGINNDIYPTSPTNIQADNVISVGATYKYDFLAPFSNYGVKSVDVVAPGMLVESQIPGNEYLKLSGTSQAAPYIANIAAQIKDTNNNLTPKQIKKIIMGTVDYKTFLENKVKSKGIVNNSRALFAANLTLKTDIAAAIADARANVMDRKANNVKMLPKGAHDIIPIPLAPMFR